MAAEAAAGAVLEAAVVVEEENHENGDLNQAHGLSVEMKPQRELGHGKLRSGRLLVSPFVEELWFIRSGLLQQLTVPRKNPPPAFV